MSLEYFPIGICRRTGYDQNLPGEGPLIWHIDGHIPEDTNKDRSRVALEQADGRRHLEAGLGNRGDSGDAFPVLGKTRFLDAKPAAAAKPIEHIRRCQGYAPRYSRCL